MTVLVTLNVYSGRPSPSWLLSDKQDAELKERLASAQQVTTQRPSGSFGGLGYRGFSLTRQASHPEGPLSMLVHEGIVDHHLGGVNTLAGPELESWLFKIAPSAVTRGVTDHVMEMLGKAQALGVPHASACPQCHAADAPAYTPSTWNVPNVQPHNNCYNFANNKITNTFAQPGRATGHIYKSFTCASVQPAAASDGLAATKGVNAPLKAGHGFYVALVIWPGHDFHWYRQDKVGCWSHKPGSTAVRDVDNAGKKITDPSTCNRGPYTAFCSYMVTTSSIRIS